MTLDLGGVQGHVDSKNNLCEVVNSLTLRMNKAESEVSELRETVVQLGLAALSAPSTPMKPTPVPVKTFEFLNTGLQDQETFETKTVGSNQKKKAAKTHARKDLQVKIPGIKIPTIAPLPSGQPDVSPTRPCLHHRVLIANSPATLPAA